MAAPGAVVTTKGSCRKGDILVVQNVNDSMDVAIGIITELTPLRNDKIAIDFNWFVEYPDGADEYERFIRMYKRSNS